MWAHGVTAMDLAARRMPAGRGRPPEAAARRAGLEVVEKLLTSKPSKSLAMRDELVSRARSGVVIRLASSKQIDSWCRHLNNHP